MAMNIADTGIKTVKVNRADLLKKLQENLETHKELYAEAVRGYEDAKVTRLRELQSAVNAALTSNTEPNRQRVHEAYGELSGLSRPQDHSESYLLAIDMMTWETKEQVELSINDFQCYVRDKWNWKHEFRNSVSNYAAAHIHRA